MFPYNLPFTLTAPIEILRNRELTDANLVEHIAPNSRISNNDAAVVEDQDEHSSDDSESTSEYLSFETSGEEDIARERAARERERELVLEAAGLVVQKDDGYSIRPKVKSIKRRPAPSASNAALPSVGLVSTDKDLPPVPVIADEETKAEMSEPELSHEARLDDAFARYEAFKNMQSDSNRLSVVSIESTEASAGSLSVSLATQSQNQTGRVEAEGGKYSNFLHFLSRSKTPDPEHREWRRKSAALVISSPIHIPSSTNQLQESTKTGKDGIKNRDSQSFGMSWASLVDKTALDGIPPGERKRQEAIFELINTEIAYVRDLQLIVEVWCSSIFASTIQ